MNIKRVNRKNNTPSVDKEYKELIRKENRYHIWEETYKIKSKRNVFKSLQAVDKKEEKEPSKIKTWYDKSSFKNEVLEVREDLKYTAGNIKYYFKKLRFFTYDLIEQIENNIFNVSVLLLGVALIFVGIFAYNNMYGYEVIFNGNNIGVVKEVEDFEQALVEVDSNLSKWYSNPNVFYEKSISYKKVPLDTASEVLDEETCAVRIYDTGMPLFCDGAIITVDGQETVKLASEEQAKTVIDNIGSEYNESSEGEKIIQEAEVEQDIDVVNKIISVDSVQSVDSAIAYLNGDISALANDGGSNPVEILASEKDEETNMVSALNFRRSAFSSSSTSDVKPKLTITTVKEVTYTEDIEFERVYSDDPTIFVGDEIIKTEGVNGSKEIVAIKTYENGVVVKTEIQNETIISEPSSELVARGTMPLPPVESTGRFLIPASGTVSAYDKPGSHSGKRALDIANSPGTPVYAADSGVVSLSGWYMGYGITVIINHGNGYSTLYGHNSSNIVSVGDKVQQGQKIANMGNTGISTGPHCHFEIQYNGTNLVLDQFFSYLTVGIQVRALQK